MERLDCVVIGAGVVGLAVAAALAGRGLEVVVLEREPIVGQHASSRNSGVIHAGIYYPAGSWKARACVAGKQMLYRYCESRDIAFRKTGKLIVATRADEVTTLREYYSGARANGVDDLGWLSSREIAAVEPAVSGEAALLSPGTGIVDTHEFLLALVADIEARGGHVLCHHPVTSGSVASGKIRLVIDDGRMEIACSIAINSAGLFATDVARSVDGLDERRIPDGRGFTRSRFYAYSGKAPFERLIYPVAAAGVAGIHSIERVDGSIGFGPDAEHVDEVDYSFDDSRRDAFAAHIRAYWPAVDSNCLVPDYCGISAALHDSAGPLADFVLRRGGDTGAARNFWNLFGMDSPALTAALAVAEDVADRVGRICDA